MKVNIFDVAKKSGLSVVTVSRVLNNAPTVRPGNRAKVLRAMEELNYYPNASARSLASGRTGVIGLTITTLNDTVFDAMVKVINQRLSDHGYFLALSISSGGEGAFQRSMFQEDRVDGVILLSPVDAHSYIEELMNRSIPFVVLDDQQQHATTTSVNVNNYKGGYEAARHLIELGHTQISHIRGPRPQQSSADRERGMLDALAEAGLDLFDSQIGDFDIPSGYRIAQAWIEAGRLPTAIFAADDYMAIGAMDACKNAGIQIPEELSIIGFDDQQFASQFTPALTTIAQPYEQVALQGVDLLLAAIRNAEPQAASLLFDPQLIVRHSTAAPRNR